MMPQVRLAACSDSAGSAVAVSAVAGSEPAGSDSARRRFPVRAGVLVAALAAALLLGGCAGLPWGKQENLRGGYGPKDRVTAILPGSGPVAGVAEALRQGLRAAHGADDTGTRPTLDFVASDQPGQIGEAYKKALAGGATHVIGPLLKPAVDVLAGGPALKVPTLALNQTTKPGKTAANLYQFALAPETEAVDVANKAKAQGFTRALMLTSTGEAGQRRADAFRRQWKTLGGTLVGEATIDPAKGPAQNLDRLLAKGGADFLILAVDAEQARQVYPILRGKAATLPIVATSAVFSGGSDAARDKALAGLYFVDAPWMLGVGVAGVGAAEDPLALAKLKRGSGTLATPLGLRLYAMGLDAYRLTPRLATLAKTPGAGFPGATGTLSIDAQGRVQRALTLAQFTPAGPKTVATMAVPAGTPAGTPAGAPAAGAAAPAAKAQAKPGSAAPPESKAESAARPAATVRTEPKPKPKRTAPPQARPVPKTESAAPVPPTPGPAPAAAPAPTPIANLATAPAPAAVPTPVAKPEPQSVNPQIKPEPAAPAPAPAP